MPDDDDVRDVRQGKPSVLEAAGFFQSPLQSCETRTSVEVEDGRGSRLGLGGSPEPIDLDSEDADEIPEIESTPQPEGPGNDTFDEGRLEPLKEETPTFDVFRTALEDSEEEPVSGQLRTETRLQGEFILIWPVKRPTSFTPTESPDRLASPSTAVIGDLSTLLWGTWTNGSFQRQKSTCSHSWWDWSRRR